MKLWKKISLLCGIILALTVAACTCIQLIVIQQSMDSLIHQRMYLKSRTLETGFQQMASYHSSETDTPAARRAVLHYCFSRLADSNCVLIVDGEKIWSETEIAMEELLPIEDDVDEVDGVGEDFIFTGSKFRLNISGSPECVIYVMESTAGMKRTLREMRIAFSGIGVAAIALGLGLAVLFIRRAMKPLQTLQSVSAEIAEGNYDRRAQITTRDEVGVLAVSFNHMADSVEAHVQELTEAAERQRLFTSAVTHEFKTPLTGILLNADSIQNTCMSEDEQEDALYAIQEQGQWLEKLVQKLLKLLTLKQGITKVTVSVPEFLESVRETTAEVLRQRGIALDIQCGMETLQGESDLLRSALVNLVDNASKASKPGQTIWLTAGGHIIEVADQGTGISPEDLKHITEPFYMADRSRSKLQGGVGLGLALVKEIITAHGGTLEVESTPGIGTIVRLRFPS